MQTMQSTQTVQTEYFSFLILIFAFTFDLHTLWLWSQINVQLYFGVFVYAKAALARYVTVDVLLTMQRKLHLVLNMLK